MSRTLQEGRKKGRLSWGIMFQAERSTYAKVLRQECRQGLKNRKEASVLTQNKEE